MFHVAKKEVTINFSFYCDSYNGIMWNVCCFSSIFGLQCVRSKSTPFILRFNNCKACNRRFLGTISEVPKADIFRNFAGEGNRRSPENVRVAIINRLHGKERESFWQYNLDTFVPQILNNRQLW